MFLQPVRENCCINLFHLALKWLYLVENTKFSLYNFNKYSYILLKFLICVVRKTKAKKRTTKKKKKF